MNKNYIIKYFYIATVFAVAILFLQCKPSNPAELLGLNEKVFPQGIAKDFTLYYNELEGNLNPFDIEPSETTLVAILKSNLSEDYEHLPFGYRIFPEGLELTLFDTNNEKTVITSDYGKLFSRTALVDLKGHVKIVLPDGKVLNTDQLYWDRNEDWIFTEHPFTYINPDDNSIMDGEGMDFKRDFTYFNAHKTYGTIVLKEE